MIALYQLHGDPFHTIALLLDSTPMSVPTVPLGTNTGVSSFSYLDSHTKCGSLIHSPIHRLTCSSTHWFIDVFTHLSIHSASLAQIRFSLWAVLWKLKFPGRGT